jgi:hypothetical protein
MALQSWHARKQQMAAATAATGERSGRGEERFRCPDVCAADEHRQVLIMACDLRCKVSLTVADEITPARVHARTTGSAICFGTSKHSPHFIIERSEMYGT